MLQPSLSWRPGGIQAQPTKERCLPNVRGMLGFDLMPKGPPIGTPC